MFGNKKLLTGSGQEYEFQVGAFGGSENVISYTMDANSTGSELGISGLSIADKDDARDSLEQMDEGIEKLAAIRADFGAMQSRLITARSNTDIQVENLSAANLRYLTYYNKMM
jgi:flagellin